jgi:hypothetical protein
MRWQCVQLHWEGEGIRNQHAFESANRSCFTLKHKNIKLRVKERQWAFQQVPKDFQQDVEDDGPSIDTTTTLYVKNIHHDWVDFRIVI